MRSIDHLATEVTAFNLNTNQLRSDNSDNSHRLFDYIRINRPPFIWYTRCARSHSEEVIKEEQWSLRLFITTAFCLLALVMAPQSARAQDVSTNVPRYQESVSQNDEADPSEAQIARAPFKQSRLFTRLGLLVAPYHSSATIATNGQLLSGGTAEASNNVSMTFELGYEITNNISVSVMSGIPVKPHVTGEGAAAPLGVLGKVRYGPMIFTGQYQFRKMGRIRPYVGGGTAYAIIFKNFNGSVKNLQVNNNWGSVLQGGAEYELNSKYTLFFDFKEVWLAVNAHGVLSDGTAVKARVNLNPSLLTVGIKFHLPFGRSH